MQGSCIKRAFRAGGKPRPIRPARSLSADAFLMASPASVLTSLLLGLAFATTGPAPSHTTVAPRAFPQADSAFALLSRVRMDALSEAFATLPRYTYTRQVRTEQLDAAHTLTAFREQRARITTLEGRRVLTTEAVRSAGTFDAGLANRFAEAPDTLYEAHLLTDYVLPEDPAYREPRNREAYTYRFRPDTLLWGRPVQVVEVSARPEVGDAQAIRQVRLYVEKATETLVGLDLELTTRTLLFQERNHTSIRLRPALEGGWVPAQTRFEVFLDLPFTPPRYLRTTTTYYAFSRAATP